VENVHLTTCSCIIASPFQVPIYDSLSKHPLVAHNSVNTCHVKWPTKVEILPSIMGQLRWAQVQYGPSRVSGPIWIQLSDTNGWASHVVHDVYLGRYGWAHPYVVGYWGASRYDQAQIKVVYTRVMGCRQIRLGPDGSMIYQGIDWVISMTRVC
jgi:hypothetical protein